jgi:hypothetical protein
VTCFLDLDVGTISYAKNGKDLGVAFELPPEARSIHWSPYDRVRVVNADP